VLVALIAACAVQDVAAAARAPLFAKLMEDLAKGDDDDEEGAVFVPCVFVLLLFVLCVCARVGALARGVKQVHINCIKCASTVSGCLVEPLAVAGMSHKESALGHRHTHARTRAHTPPRGAIDSCERIAEGERSRSRSRKRDRHARSRSR
jgi:hypothetical protein